MYFKFVSSVILLTVVMFRSSQAQNNTQVMEMKFRDCKDELGKDVVRVLLKVWVGVG